MATNPHPKPHHPHGLRQQVFYRQMARPLSQTRILLQPQCLFTSKLCRSQSGGCHCPTIQHWLNYIQVTALLHSIATALLSSLFSLGRHKRVDRQLAEGQNLFTSSEAHYPYHRWLLPPPPDQKIQKQPWDPKNKGVHTIASSSIRDTT